MARDRYLFDLLDAINLKKPIVYDKKKVPAYILCLWLSESPDLIHIVNQIIPYLFNMPDEVIFKYFMDKVPKKKRFIKWTKKEGKKKKEKLLEELMEMYDISEREAMRSIK